MHLTTTHLIEHGVPVGTAVALAATPGIVMLTGSYGGFIASEDGTILYAFDADNKPGVAPEYADHARFDLAEWRAWATPIGRTGPFLDITEVAVILTDGSRLEASELFRDIQQENHP